MLLTKLIRFGLIFSARMSGAAALFGVNLLIVHFLGIEALGTYAIFVSLVSIMAVIISSGYTAIAPIFIAEYAKKQQFELHKGFMQNALKQGAVITLLFVLLLLTTQIAVGIVPFLESSELGIAALLSAIAIALLGFNGGVLVGMKKQVAALVPETFIRPVLFLFLTGICLGVGLISTITELLWLVAVSAWLTIGFVFVRDRALFRKLFNADASLDKTRWRRASAPWMGITLLWDFMIDIVLLLVSLLAGSIEIAILHICFRYRVLAGFGMRTIHTLMMPEITEQAIEKNRDGLMKKLFQVNAASLAYSLGAFTGFAVLADWLFGIFSMEATVGLPILLTISATMVIRAVFGPAPLLLAIHNIHTITLKVSLITIIFAMILIGIFYSEYGIITAAVVYTAANLIISAALWHISKQKTGIDTSIFSALFRGKQSSPVFQSPSGTGA